MPNLGLLYIATVLEDNGFDVEVIDSNIERIPWKRLGDRISKINPRLIGVTGTTENRFAAFELIRFSRRIMPEAAIVAGGPHATLASEDTLRHIKELDIIVRGEGEYTMLELMENIRKGKSVEDISGISYRNSKGDIVHNRDRPFIQDLDKLPIPSRKFVPIDRYNFYIDVPGKGKRKFLNIVTSRGCAFQCVFCATSRVWGNRWRHHSPERVVAEIEYLKHEYDIQGIWFNDDAFNTSKKRVNEICGLFIEKGLDISWWCEVRVDSIDRETLKLMKDAGCFCAVYGAESGSQRILDTVINKHINVNQIRDMNRWCREAGIESRGLFIISLPGETKEDARMTIDLIKELGGKQSINILKIHPGTGVEQIAREKGIIPGDFTWTRNTQSQIMLKGVVGDAPVFVDRLSWKELSDLMVEFALQQKWPFWKRIWPSLKAVKSIEDLKRLIIIGAALLKALPGLKKMR